MTRTHVFEITFATLLLALFAIPAQAGPGEWFRSGTTAEPEGMESFSSETLIDRIGLHPEIMEVFGAGPPGHPTVSMPHLGEAATGNDILPDLEPELAAKVADWLKLGRDLIKSGWILHPCSWEAIEKQRHNRPEDWPEDWLKDWLETCHGLSSSNPAGSDQHVAVSETIVDRLLKGEGPIFHQYGMVGKYPSLQDLLNWLTWPPALPIDKPWRRNRVIFVDAETVGELETTLSALSFFQREVRHFNVK